MRHPDPLAHRCLATDHECEPIRAHYLALWTKDATYLDPIMDAWGRDVVERLIDALSAAIRALLRMRRNAGAGGAIPLSCADRPDGAAHSGVV